ncbi:DEAD/DEAH box helicase family protein [Synechococcus sp. ATX 2A4]|uniref:DEAD/DEAH box helicase n=1 Tax=Synechococcus sp. ATX 2A4 TaxID=2823727 RepID=UPI0020CE856E|nr:DEAD/DEAH box helicase [Synechococcus sp. ATX 2A4]MCP9886197.1 DEAD/DEAH box helicase family protein [Synechococcus sp. ATX 2A4]
MPRLRPASNLGVGLLSFSKKTFLMVDFKKLRAESAKAKPIDPLEIFRRQPKPPEINDLYTSQAEVLREWNNRRDQQDIVVKLHTGGGKTLVGLLIAQSTINEKGGPVLYLVPTNQLVKQTSEKARQYGIETVVYEKGRALSESFERADIIMIATYRSLFNGRSKFGLLGQPDIQSASAVILDDAHVAFGSVRDSFTLEIEKQKLQQRYFDLCTLFRLSFREIDKLGTFDDIVAGRETGLLEVPYWAWLDHIESVKTQLSLESSSYPFVWPLLRDNLHLCHALVSHSSFTITPVLPLVNLFPTFSASPRRVYMSATISDDSEIVRTFNANAEFVRQPLSSQSLAGVSERMILIPDLMNFEVDTPTLARTVIQNVSQQGKGTVILSPSDYRAAKWADVAMVARGTEAVEKAVDELQKGVTIGPIAFSNRYDGIDLPGNSCRLLLMDGLPGGSSAYEQYRRICFYGGNALTRLLAQRIEQGIGRGARGSGDHCVVIMTGKDLSAWISKAVNYQFLTDATKAQIEMGAVISESIAGEGDVLSTVNKGISRDTDWTSYHAEKLADMVQHETTNQDLIDQASVERRAFGCWQRGYPEQAITKIERYLQTSPHAEKQVAGWLLQFAGRIANAWGNTQKAQDLQAQAFSFNENLTRPRVKPPYQRIAVPAAQERAICEQLNEYRARMGLLSSFEYTVSLLTPESSSNIFERELANLARFIGLSSERFDNNGQGPDVLWLLPSATGIVIEAKSRKQGKNVLTKEQHGQLLVAEQWFNVEYPGQPCHRASVHPTSNATRNAIAQGSLALTYEKLAELVSDARRILKALVSSQRSGPDLISECAQFLQSSNLNHERIVGAYFLPFQEID